MLNGRETYWFLQRLCIESRRFVSLLCGVYCIVGLLNESRDKNDTPAILNLARVEAPDSLGTELMRVAAGCVRRRCDAMRCEMGRRRNDISHSTVGLTCTLLPSISR